MEAQLQGFERAAGNHQLAVQHEAIFCNVARATRHLGKIPLEWFLVSGLQVDPPSVSVGKAAKAIVLRLELPPPAVGSSSTASASIGGRSKGSGVEVAVIGSPVSAGSLLPEILLLAPEHNAQRAIWQRPLQRLGLESMARPAMSPTPTAQSGSPAWPWDGSPRPQRWAPKSGTRTDRRAPAPP